MANQKFTEKNGKFNSLVISTPIGDMLAVADEYALRFLQFVDDESFGYKIQKVKQDSDPNLSEKETEILKSIKLELEQYFSGNLKKFKTPIKLLGTKFQREVWENLIKIPYGETRSYTEQAELLGNKSLCRAAANANNSNKLAIIVPCHRVINITGVLGGYSGGVDRKEWLLKHEKKYLSKLSEN